MRRFFVLLLLPLLLTSGCKDKVCEPYEVRERSGQWWVCNSDGTHEEYVTAPRLSETPYSNHRR